MSYNKSDLVQFRIKKARETFKDVEPLFPQVKELIDKIEELLI